MLLADLGGLRTTYRNGRATITRTTMADEASVTIFLHLLADHPGVISFRVLLSMAGSGEAEIVDRRQLVIPARQADSPGAHVWVLLRSSPMWVAKVIPSASEEKVRHSFYSL